MMQMTKDSETCLLQLARSIDDDAAHYEMDAAKLSARAAALRSSAKQIYNFLSKQGTVQEEPKERGFTG